MIKNKKKLPQGLAEKQELQRQETINKVLRACADIKNAGGKVTILSLVEYTGLSRSTFAKPHIREVLAEYGYVFGNESAVVRKRKKSKQDEIIAEKDRQIAELKHQNHNLEKECRLLRGKLFMAVQEQSLTN